MNNKYIKRAKISEYTFRKVVRYFVYDLELTKISQILVAFQKMYLLRRD